MTTHGGRSLNPRAVWVVDPDRWQVKISTPDGHTIHYQADQEILLPLFGHAKVAVDAIFW